jgi:predicted DNA-binding transcriptional regulator YafY
MASPSSLRKGWWRYCRESSRKRHRSEPDSTAASAAALLREERIRVTREGVSGSRKTFILEPYTLLVYKRGLYLAGLSEGHGGEVRTFALDGSREVEWLRDERFEYPADFRPEQLTEGAFGLIRGKEATRVRIWFDGEGREVRAATTVAPHPAFSEGRGWRRDDSGSAGDG